MKNFRGIVWAVGIWVLGITLSSYAHAGIPKDIQSKLDTELESYLKDCSSESQKDSQENSREKLRGYVNVLRSKVFSLGVPPKDIAS